MEPKGRLTLAFLGFELPSPSESIFGSIFSVDGGGEIDSDSNFSDSNFGETERDEIVVSSCFMDGRTSSCGAAVTAARLIARCFMYTL